MAQLVDNRAKTSAGKFMSLKERIVSDMNNAMRSKEKERLSVLRMVKSAIMNKEIDNRGDLTDEDIVKILNTLVKQRRDSAEQYEKGGRPELAAVETAEIAFIENYLPEPASAEEIEQAVDDAISALGASSMKEMGTVMKNVIEKLSGKTVDGKSVSEVVRSKLQ